MLIVGYKRVYACNRVVTFLFRDLTASDGPSTGHGHADGASLWAVITVQTVRRKTVSHKINGSRQTVRRSSSAMLSRFESLVS